MEFVLEAAEGLPSGGVLSMRLGESRLQGPANKIGQAYRFANISPATVEELSLRLQVLAPAAPGRIVDLDPEKKSFTVDFDGQIKLTFCQKEVAGPKREVMDMSGVATKDQPVDKQQLATDAAAYLEKHDLVKLFQELLHGIMVSQPPEPLQYLDSRVSQRAREARRRKAKAERGQELARKGAGPPRGSIFSRSKVDALLDILQRTSKNLPLIIPFLPRSLSDVLVSAELADECRRQFEELDRKKLGRLGPEELTPIIVQLSTASDKFVTYEQCERFIELFDADEDGTIQAEEFTTLTQFVIISAHLESDEGKQLVEQVRLEEERCKELLAILEKDKARINEVVPFLPDWLVMHITSDHFMDDCMRRFDEMDSDRSGKLEPPELLPVVIALTHASPLTIDIGKCERFVRVFDRSRMGCIRRSEFIDFAQFFAVMNFLSSTVEGEHVSRAAEATTYMHATERYIRMLEQGHKRLHDVVPHLPKPIVEDIMSENFIQRCVEGFNAFDKKGRKVLHIDTLFALVQKLCAEHPVTMDKIAYRKYAGLFGLRQRSLVSFDEMIEFARFILVLSYLITTRDWNNQHAVHSRERIEALIEYLKTHCEKIEDILPFLPTTLHEELVSPDFAAHCLEDFHNLDKDQNGVLTPKELIPVVLHLSDSHLFALTEEQCLKFVDLFDTNVDGVLTNNEFINFARFLMILSYLETEEGQVVNENAEINLGVKRVEELLSMLSDDRSSLPKVMGLLPEEIFDELTSDHFIDDCRSRFQDLDKDHNGVLDPTELFPVVRELSEAHPYAIDYESCRRFTEIFDIHGDGVIRLDEFVDFARFLCIMSYLHSDDGKERVEGGLHIMAGSKQVDELLDLLHHDRRQLRKVIPYLPEDLRTEILSQEFAITCMDSFRALDKNQNGTLEPAELYPVIITMTNAHHRSIDLEQCSRFTDIFDDERTGVISKAEFVNFARFLVVMSFLQTEDGKKTMEIATLDNHKVSVTTDSQGHVEEPFKELPAPPSEPPKLHVEDADHLAVDVDFYKGKSERLEQENAMLRKRMQDLEDMVRSMEGRIEEQGKKLRHAEVDLRATGRPV